MNYSNTKIDNQGRINMVDLMDNDDVSANTNNLGSSSLADAFQKNKAKLREKLDIRKDEEIPIKKVEKSEVLYDKHRLAQLRKDMRKKPNLQGRSPQCEKNTDCLDDQKDHPNSVNNFNHKNGGSTPTSTNFSNMSSFNNNTAYSGSQKTSVIQQDNIFTRMMNAKQPNPELLERLAKGQKAKVSKKEMLTLTNKNYNLLPEIQAKKEKCTKKEDFKERTRKVKEMDMVNFLFKTNRNEGQSYL